MKGYSVHCTSRRAPHHHSQLAYEVNNTKKVTESGKIVIVPASLRLAKSKMRSNGGGGWGQSRGRQRKSARQNKAWLTFISDNKRTNKDPHLLDWKQLLKPHTQVALSSCVKWRTPDGNAALAGTCAQQWSSEDYWTCRIRFFYLSRKIFLAICQTSISQMLISWTCHWQRHRTA